MRNIFKYNFEIEKRKKKINILGTYKTDFEESDFPQTPYSDFQDSLDFSQTPHPDLDDSLHFSQAPDFDFHKQLGHGPQGH